MIERIHITKLKLVYSYFKIARLQEFYLTKPPSNKQLFNDPSTWEEAIKINYRHVIVLNVPVFFESETYLGTLELYISLEAFMLYYKIMTIYQPIKKKFNNKEGTPNTILGNRSKIFFLSKHFIF